VVWKSQKSRNRNVRVREKLLADSRSALDWMRCPISWFKPTCQVSQFNTVTLFGAHQLEIHLRVFVFFDKGNLESLNY
jgi:hypothetical protein